MFKNVNIQEELARVRRKIRKEEEVLLSEAKRILKKDLFAEKKILENLKQYNKTFNVLDEEDVDADLIFTTKEIKRMSVMMRLKFLDSKMYKPEIPYEAILKIKHLESKFAKDLKVFKILSPQENFLGKNTEKQSSLFVKTNYENYYLVHQWGKDLSWSRKIKFWPLRTFETLALTVLVTTLIITLCLPTAFITLDSKATYWSGYRGAAFFHLLIFNFGVTVYFTFAFTLNFSSSVWNKLKDFG